MPTLFDVAAKAQNSLTGEMLAGVIRSGDPQVWSGWAMASPDFFLAPSLLYKIFG